MSRRYPPGPGRYRPDDDSRRHDTDRGAYVCAECGSDQIEPRRMRSGDRWAERDEYRQRRHPREVRYDYRYDDGDDYRGGDWGRDDVYPYSRSSMSGYEEPWHRGWERERSHSGYDYEEPPHREPAYDDFARDEERAFRDERELDYRLRERDYDTRDEPWRRR